MTYPHMKFHIFGAISGILGAGKSATGFLEAGLQEDIAEFNADQLRIQAAEARQQVTLAGIGLDRMKRDINDARKETITSTRAILASRGGEGLSDQVAINETRDQAAEFQRGETRLTQDFKVKRRSLLMRARNLEKQADFTEDVGQAQADITRIGAGAGVAGGILSAIASIAPFFSGAPPIPVAGGPGPGIPGAGSR